MRQRQHNFRFFLNDKRRSVSSLLNETPEGGCMLVFNGRHNTWRTKASELAKYLDRSMSVHKLSAEERPVYCDMYITIGD